MKNTFDKKSFVVVACIVVVILCFIFLNPFYTVQENEAALITRLGKIHAVESEPGLHWRVPMLDDVQSISMKVLRIDGDTQKIPTRDNRCRTVLSLAA